MQLPFTVCNVKKVNRVMNHASIPPTIVFCVTGELHLIYLNWSINSLLRHEYENIFVLVGTAKEKAIVNAWFPDIELEIVSVDIGEYPGFSYKPFALKKWIKSGGSSCIAGPIVVCDADILWKRNPEPLFRRFGGQCWVHKITAVNPSDYDLPAQNVPKSNIGLRTIMNYHAKEGVTEFPNFILNAGLFKLEKDPFLVMVESWMDKILKLPPSEMLMSEALMSLTYAELGLVPIADQTDIKHFGKHLKNSFSGSVFPFATVPPDASKHETGYEVATHYYGDQRLKLHEDVRRLDLDPDGLAPTAKRLRAIDTRRKRVGRLKKFLRIPG